MNRGLLAGAVVLLAMSMLCIVATTVQMLQGQYGFGHWRFWAAAVFHPGTAVAGAWLLSLAVPPRDEPESEGVPAAEGESS